MYFWVLRVFLEVGERVLFSRGFIWFSALVVVAVCFGRRAMFGWWVCGSMGGIGCGGGVRTGCIVWRGEGGILLGVICGKVAGYIGWVGSWVTAG